VPPMIDDDANDEFQLLIVSSCLFLISDWDDARRVVRGTRTIFSYVASMVTMEELLRRCADWLS
jgi:hypothetical protein